MRFITIPRPLLLLLSFVGGWADVATFIGLDYLLSAHITGNIVVFAAQVVDGPTVSDALKVLMIPVFFAAVMLITLLNDAHHQKQPDKPWLSRLLTFEAILLIVGGLSALVGPMIWPDIKGFLFDAHVATIIVTAMAFQNAAHRLYPLGAATTVMTGNVTQFCIDWLRVRKNTTATTGRPRVFPEAGLPMQILAFAAGCLVSAVTTKSYGVATVIIPGTILLLVCLAGHVDRE